MLEGMVVGKDKSNTLSGQFAAVLCKGTCARLSSLYQTPFASNQNEALQHNLRMIIAGLLYFIFCSFFFNEFWYHVLISVFSTLVFIYLLDQRCFEKKRSLLINTLPLMLNKVAHYYSHLDGNLISALEEAEKQTPIITKAYIVKIKEALLSINRDYEIKQLQAKMPFSWLKVLCGLLLSISKEGYSINTDKSNGVSDILRRMASAISCLNIQQGYNNAEFIHYEKFLFICPFFIIPATRLFNASLLKYIDIPDVYSSIRAQTIAALIFLLSNLSVLFVNWIRKAES